MKSNTNMSSPVHALVISSLINPLVKSSSHKEEKQQTFTISDLCDERYLPASLFENQTMRLEDDTAKHAAWMFNNIYIRSYFGGPKTGNNTIARFHHGIQHVSRTAMYVPVFVNLYRRYKDPEALALSQDDVKLLQIAMLLHDAARRGEGKDYWDRESGIFVYEYLTRVLKVNADKAKLLAEAVTTNKEPKEGKYYYKITVLSDGCYRCEKTEYTKKNIYQRIIQNADCLDIKRVRPVFDAEYLDFYQDIAKDNELAFEEMAHLIAEVRSLLTLQGDDCDDPDVSKKVKYENENCYLELMKCVFGQDNKITSHYRVIRGLYHATGAEVNKNLLSDLLEKKSDTEYKLTEANLEKLMWNGRLLVRVVNPTVEVKRPNKDTETGIAFEVRKIKRRIGVATRSKKKNRTDKLGFDKRSTSMVSPNTGIFNLGSESGYLFIPELKHVQKVSSTNCLSGIGKKTHLEKLEPLKDPEQELKDLNKLLKKGGDSKGYKPYHTEIIYRVTEAHAVFYSTDAFVPGGDHKTYAIPFLNAILIKKEFQNQMNVDLPVVEYSYKHNMIKFRRFNNDTIKQLWHKLFIEYLKKLSDNEIIKLHLSPQGLNDAKEKSVGVKYCANYDSKLNSEIDQLLKDELSKKINDSYKNNEILFVKAIAGGNFLQTEYKAARDLLEKYSINKDKFLERFISMIRGCFFRINSESSGSRAPDLESLKFLYQFSSRYFSSFCKTIRDGLLEVLLKDILDPESSALKVREIKDCLNVLYPTYLYTGTVRSRIVSSLLKGVDWGKGDYLSQLSKANLVLNVSWEPEIFASFNAYFTLNRLNDLDKRELKNYLTAVTSYFSNYPAIYKGNHFLLMNDIINGKFLEEKSTLDLVLTAYSINTTTFNSEFLRKTRRCIRDLYNSPCIFNQEIEELKPLKALYKVALKYNLDEYANLIRDTLLNIYWNKSFIYMHNRIKDFLDEFKIDTKKPDETPTVPPKELSKKFNYKRIGLFPHVSHAINLNNDPMTVLHHIAINHNNDNLSRLLAKVDLKDLAKTLITANLKTP